jgi:homoprotocatechuate degradation regulator HpaR
MSINAELERAPMEQPPVKFQQANMPLLLLRGRERLLSYFRPILNAHGLTEQQWRILRVLLEAPLEPRQICEVCCISSPSLVGVLTRMQQLDLIHRTAVPHDQRRLLISPTARARRLAATIIPDIERAYRDIESRVGKPLLRQLSDSLRELLNVLEPFHSERETAEPQVDLESNGRPKRGPGARSATAGTFRRRGVPV